MPGKAVGTVERIGFRSTSLRLFDTSLITLPNHVFSEASIINYSKRKFRRINWNIGLVYKTSLEQLKSICEQITLYIKNSDNFVVNDEFKLFVRVEKFNDSSIDLLVYTFTSTNDWEKYLMIKEQLIFQIKSIVEENSTDFAFPSTSIYLEKNDNLNF